MVRRIRGAKYRLDRIILDELLERLVRLLAACGLRQAFPPIGKQITHCHDFDIRVILESKSCPELAEAIPHNAHANLPIRNWFPSLGRFRGSLFDFFETLNWFAVLVDDILRSVRDPVSCNRYSAHAGRL